MFVSQVMQNKPVHEVATSGEDTRVAPAAQLMTERGVGSLVVLGRGGKIAGIVTERDILRRFARHGAQLGGMRLAEIMSTPVETVQPDALIEDVLHRMTLKRFRHLPVVDGGRLVGIVSIGDLVKAMLQEKTAESESLRQYITS
ncbi:MAG TPA: CBS domain-containing protein [Gammaproteobacteria bacterium]|nr:CBS domain-containing protein [Gammaproteobacteria bacterium]